VKLFRLDEGDRIADVTIVMHENDENDEQETEIIADDGQERLL
jgi:hypothetical protein